MNVTLRGAFPVLPTAFTDAGVIDEPAFRRIVAFALDCGVDGVVFPGLASEYDCLSLDERLHLIGVVGGMSAGRAAFVVGASSDDPAETPLLATAGAAAGAAAAMVMTPKRLDGDAAALTGFYEQLGESAALPIMLQNAPRPMGLGLAPAAIADIAARVPIIRYLKEETMPCGQRISALRAAVPDTVAGIFGGAGGRYILDELARGAVGTMPAAELADLHVGLIVAHCAGDLARARTLYERMLPILTMQAVFRWSLTKEVLRHRGILESVHVRAEGPRFDRQDRVEMTAMLMRLTNLLAASPVPVESLHDAEDVAR